MPARFCPVPVTYDAEAVRSAIKRLKLGKAVPDTRVPAEIWRLCSEALIPRFQQALATGQQPHSRLPMPMTDCNLALSPKPNQTGRQPQDLRPIGLQDPSSKILATLIRDQVVEQAKASKCPAICIPGTEVYCGGSMHCRRVRDSLKRAVVSVEQKRAGRRAASCIGGAMLSLDLSKRPLSLSE